MEHAVTAEAPRVAGVRISHPERVLDPTGVTKLALARYYEGIAPWMLPHVVGRPLTLVRWAEGAQTEKGGVYLRHARAWGPRALTRVSIREKTKVGEYLVVESLEALVSLAQMDILEIHTWNATIDDLEHPDRVVFDLDPGPGVGWDAIANAARHVRRALEDEGLESSVKTTGGKGLHVIAPLARDRGWDECLAFSRDVVRRIVREDPARYVLTMSKAARPGRIFIDYLRNARANTSVAAYSTRARPNAPVSMPIAWDEIDDVDPAAFTMDAVRKKTWARKSKRSRR
ncbi:MAG TPA: non-homologous end-joining DNA ligase [Polyangiaceae bacterium]|jgi:bifunctional non-homologous end joining protein LigD